MNAAPMTLRPASWRNVRGHLRRRARRRLAGPGPGQPDRRAHRLQRGLCPAVRHRQAAPGRPSRLRRGPHRPAAVHLRRPEAGRRPTLATLAPGAVDRLDRVPARRGLGAAAARHRRSRASTCSWTPTCRCGAGLSSSARDRMRRRHRPCNELTGAGLCGRATWSWLTQRAENDVRRRPHRHHGPVRVAARRRRPRRLPGLPRPERRELVPFDAEAAGLVLLVIDTKVSHSHADGGYAARRASCELGAERPGRQGPAGRRPSPTCARPRPARRR